MMLPEFGHQFFVAGCRGILQGCEPIGERFVAYSGEYLVHRLTQRTTDKDCYSQANRMNACF